MVAIQFDIQFDSQRVNLDRLLKGASLSNHVLTTRFIAPGYVRVVAYSKSQVLLPTNGLVLLTQFSLPAAELVGSGLISLKNAKMVRSDGSIESPLTTEGGGIFVAPVYRGIDGIAELFLNSEPDEFYLVQASQDLVNWANISTNTAFSDYLRYVDEDASRYDERFYRIKPYSSMYGAVASSTLVRNEVQRLLNSQLILGGEFSLQVSEDLIHWETLMEKVSRMEDISPESGYDIPSGHRFFRLVPRNTR